MKNITWISILVSLLLISCSKKESDLKDSLKPSNGEKTWVFGEGQVNGNLDLGEIEYGSSKLVTLIIKNDSEASIQSPPSVTGPFEVVYQRGCSNLAPGDSCLVKIYFSSVNKNPGPYEGELVFGQYSGVLSAVVGAVEENPLSIKVNSVELSETFNFGILNYRDSVIKTLVVKNNNPQATSVDLALPSSMFSSVFNSCEGRSLAPKTSCFIKMLFSGRGKEGLVNEPLVIDGREISIVASVESRNDSIENNSNLILLVDNEILEFSSTLDLGTLNTNSLVNKNIFLKTMEMM